MARDDDRDPLGAGKAFADLSFWRKIEVAGRDAFEWLNDLVSADLDGLEPGTARQSLLLSPTGRIRAAFAVTRLQPDVLLLIQDPTQPRPIDGLLEPYVLSSNVELADRTEAFTLLAFPGLVRPPSAPAGVWLSPGSLGRGVDLLAPIERHDKAVGFAEGHFEGVGAEEVERWRVLAGIPRFGVDALEEDLPQEGGLAEAISFDKGCYLGQEAVAKVRNLGHPRRVVMAMETEDPVSPGDVIVMDGNDAGRVTSAARLADRTVLLASIRWDGRGGPLRTKEGAELITTRPLP
ncbi:MAG TPA: hypothetical protein VF972_04200 [Actinomycetota bacterium]